MMFVYPYDQGKNVGIDLVKQTRENKADSAHLVTTPYLISESLSKTP
jgi:hypothetical protein